MRLDKFLAHNNIGTRKEVKQILKQGRVALNDLVIRDPGTQISEDDCCTLDGCLLANQTLVYYMLNKPQDVVSATNDNLHQTVIDLIHEPYKDLFPVGRLDIDTTGLLLITNDGQLAHRALSPKHHIPKSYQATLDGPITNKIIEDFHNGIEYGEKRPSKPAILTLIDDGLFNQVEITITEGKFHQIKRMFQVEGLHVKSLIRIRFGTLTLDYTLTPGNYRKLTSTEIETLKGYIYAK